MSSEASAQTANEPVIDKWIKNKKIVVGYEFGTPPMQFRDPSTNEPTGYTIELMKLMAADLGDGIGIEYVEVPFGQLFALLESGRCDMIEPVTKLPARALRGDFTEIPCLLCTGLCTLEAELHHSEAGGAEFGESQIRRAPGNIAARCCEAQVSEGTVCRLPLCH